MTTQRIAQIFGAVFILVGLLGLVMGGYTMSATMLLGLFPVNLLHNLVHLAIGGWGIMAAQSEASAQAFCKIAGIAYVALALLGFIIPDLFGLIPIGGNDIWLHLVIGVILSYVGFAGAPKPAGA